MSATSPEKVNLSGGNPTEEAQELAGRSYGQILKSSALIGGSSVINIGLSIARVKAMALMLGPAGVGLMGLFGSIADLAQCISGMGINSSGVRQIAAAVGAEDPSQIARTVTVLRRVAAMLGALGALLLISFATPISLLSFGTDQRAGAVALLSCAVFLTSVANGQSAVVQGMRRISDLAMINIVSALTGTLLSIPLIYYLGEGGVVPSLIGVAAMSGLAAWWFNAKIAIEPVTMGLGEMGKEAAALLWLGFAFMASGILTLGAAHLIRMIIVHNLGLEAAGLYQAAWTLGGLYVGFILQSMGADFYPRLTAMAGDDLASNQLVNQQAQISLLLAGPGVLGTLTFAPWVIHFFYSARFAPAVDILRWICLGMTLRVISWPMGFILLARGAQQAFLWTEVAATVVHLGLAWFCIGAFGIAGVGLAFCGLYVFHGFLIYGIVRRLTGFRWTIANQRVGAIYLSLIGLSAAGFHVFPFWLSQALGVVCAIAGSVYSLRRLLRLLPTTSIPLRLWGLLHFLRLAPRGLS